MRHDDANETDGEGGREERSGGGWLTGGAARRGAARMDGDGAVRGRWNERSLPSDWLVALPATTVCAVIDDRYTGTSLATRSAGIKGRADVGRNTNIDA